MKEPLVVCVMLTKNRPEMAARAVECFKRQTYERRKLLIWDNGELNRDFDLPGGAGGEFGSIGHIPAEAYRDVKIGKLRNEANAFLNTHDIVIHWDDDDTSHPMRIEEQVALLQASGADVVGYSDMLFWRGNDAPHHIAEEPDTWDGEQAWLYQNNDRGRYCLGTSLCYWRKVWEAKPFNPKLPERRGGTGEDTEWLRGLKTSAITSMFRWQGPTGSSFEDLQPRMIASIHGSNTQDYKGIEKSGNSWTRVPEWDSYCRGIMAL